ncbi:MAG: hypothetical protein IT316_12855 [Anaerolineales bacterium]|nr:hypothetical protein [Anaerolineales bacterium]
MARLEAQSKLLYYPTPPRVVELIASWFKADARARLVDPCCGKGEALAWLAYSTGETPYQYLYGSLRATTHQSASDILRERPEIASGRF